MSKRQRYERLQRRQWGLLQMMVWEDARLDGVERVQRAAFSSVYEWIRIR